MLSGGLAAFAALFVLLISGMPLALALGVVGVGGSAIVLGIQPALSMLAQVTVDTVANNELSVLPLFILMGNLIARAGIAEELFDAINALMGRRRGALGIATIGASGAFSAVCGSSLATVATMTRIALPPMRRSGYDAGFAAGTVAAGGTLGILIPPSVILVIYGIMTETPIAELFMAGIVPGLVGVALYMGAVWAVMRLVPSSVPIAIADKAVKPRLLRRILPILGLFLLVMGGIYLGFFTPTEAAGMGAAGALAIVALRRRLTLGVLFRILLESGRTTAVLIFILIGAILFANLLNLSGVPQALQAWIGASGWSPLGVIVAILIVYLVLGCVLESLSMILLTVPLFFPVVASLSFEGWFPAGAEAFAPIWFGIVVVIVTEASLITPPIGMNLFVLRAQAPDIPLGKLYIGAAPFVAADMVRILLVVAFPALALALPLAMG